MQRTPSKNGQIFLSHNTVKKDGTFIQWTPLSNGQYHWSGVHYIGGFTVCKRFLFLALG